MMYLLHFSQLFVRISGFTYGREQMHPKHSVQVFVIMEKAPVKVTVISM